VTKKAESILQQALVLDESERAEIAGALLESLEPPADAEVERAWREEVRRRLEAADTGSAELIPWEEVRDQLFARLNDRS
jgi:putative addiction module component (TIGR02574 family)